MKALAAPLSGLRSASIGTVVGIAIVGLFTLAAFVPQALTSVSPMTFDFKALLAAPSLDHPFGTDQFGRDVFSRVVWAARVDLQIALFGTVPAMAIGILVGTLVGYAGGVSSAIFGRAVDFFMTFPFMIVVIATVAVLGPGLVNMYVAIALFNWIFYARLMRSEVSVQLSEEYVSAGYVLGFSPLRILVNHVLPNCIKTIAVYWVTDMALVILLGSSLGYLGLGAQPPTPEWGVLAADGKNFFTQAPWISFFPGVAVVVCGFGLSLLGDTLSSKLEVRR
jgi:peptide/nickel transport system permease protein